MAKAMQVWTATLLATVGRAVATQLTAHHRRRAALRSSGSAAPPLAERRGGKPGSGSEAPYRRFCSWITWLVSPGVVHRLRSVRCATRVRLPYES